MQAHARKRRPAAWLGIAVLVLALFAAGLAWRRTASATSDLAAADVVMQEATFSPATLRIAAGGTVTWRNASELTHTATGSGWDSGDVGPGQSWSHTFSEPGTYPYICRPHEAAGMKGTIIVE